MRPTCCAVALAGLLPCAAAAFDRADLAGLWAESNRSHYACTPTNRYQRFELAADGRRLTITVQHRSRTRDNEVLNLDVTRSDEHSLYVRFHGHDDAADPLAGEWALTMLGPGVYRWHQASEHEGLKAAPIGVRCAP